MTHSGDIGRAHPPDRQLLEQRQWMKKAEQTVPAGHEMPLLAERYLLLVLLLLLALLLLLLLVPLLATFRALTWALSRGLPPIDVRSCSANTYSTRRYNRRSGCMIFFIAPPSVHHLCPPSYLSFVHDALLVCLYAESEN